MKSNVGSIDRTLRIVAGLAILSLYFFLGDGQRGWALLGAAGPGAARDRAGQLVPAVHPAGHPHLQDGPPVKLRIAAPTPD